MIDLFLHHLLRGLKLVDPLLQALDQLLWAGAVWA
jgi:hypothetical protein